MKILGILRKQVFSPGKVFEDAAIMDAVLHILSLEGHHTHSIAEESVQDDLDGADLILTMAQSHRVLTILEKKEKNGIPVINTTAAIRNCYRNALIEILSAARIPMPPGWIASVEALARDPGLFDKGVYWLKRGDFHALCENDVIRIRTRDDLSIALSYFREQGVRQVLVQANVEGLCAKFYGVGTGADSFFKAYMPSTGEEITNHVEPLFKVARTAAASIGLEIYGGDAVRGPDNDWKLIDLNDWPTFSLCREAAAQAILEHLRCKYAI